jgi:TonB family protein
MIRRMLLAGWVAAWCCLVTSCGRKGRPADECLFLIGGDTVSISTVNLLVPDSLPLPQKIGRAALELVCSRQCSDSGQAKRIGSDLAVQLSRQGQETWSPEAGRTLWAAARLIAVRARETGSLARASGFADSLLWAAVTVRDSASFREFRKKRSPAFDAAPPWHGDQAALEQLIATVFDLPRGASRIVCEFVAEEAAGSSRSPDMNSMIKGLVYDSASQRLKKPRPTAAPAAAAPAENSKEALRFRGRSSIKDSIEKHIPDLEALYKKHLKMHETMKGTIWVTFHIDPSGKVTSARVRTSSITEKDFLNPFHEYVAQKISFLRIPEQAGAMSVEFPFEFAPEN